MEEHREVRISIETLIKRSWPLLAFGAVLLIAVIVGLLWFAISGQGRKFTSTALPVETSSTVVISATSTDILVPRALDGIFVQPVNAELQPYAVMVENYIGARPLSGPAHANLAFEIPVEGGISRYLLVFDATTTIDAIGPVRSARPYFVDYADGLNAVYAHVGGSPQSLNEISNLAGFRDLNEFFNGKYFWRSANHTAPHNVFTRTDLLHEADASKRFRVGHFRSWHYKADEPLKSPTSSVRGTENGPALNYGHSYSYSVAWTYKRSKNVYLRSEAGRLQKDRDGVQVQAKNIIVLHTNGSVIDSEGRLKIRTTGRGKATLYRDGRKFDVIWTRALGVHVQFEGLDGTDVYFDRGTTWIEVMLDGSVSGNPSGAATSTPLEQH